MPTGWREDDADALVTGAAAGNVRRLPPIAQPRDLQAALAPLDDDQYGPKIFENLGLQDFTPDKVTRVSVLRRSSPPVLSPCVSMRVFTLSIETGIGPPQL